MRRPIVVSFYIALLVAALLSFLLFIPDFFLADVFAPDKILVVGLLVFLIVFLTSLVLLKKFVFDKIASIHSYIQDRRPLSKKNSFSSSNPLDKLIKEVEEWSDERKAEIEQLKTMESYRKEFLGNVSHELKTPIFNIQGYVLTLLDGGLEDASINRNYLERAGKSVDRMIGIVEDLQAISQLESGELTLEHERFDIVELAREIADAQEMIARNKNISIMIIGNEEKPVYVFADRFRIRQALTNLVVNSIKYGKQDGETRIRISDIGEKVRIEVSDNGIGISKEHLPRIFERFYRVDKSRSRQQGGTGLGLAIVKHIIEAHNQTINVMSAENAGSVFSFVLKKD